jgi:hypothetical protein
VKKSEIEGIAGQVGITVTKFNDKHWRLIGRATVDYWPNTSRAWEVGSTRKAKKIAPTEVIAWAATGIE